MDKRLILYTDGSFRNKKAGWGVHGYTYTLEPLKAKANLKQQPTENGYQDVDAPGTCTVVNYVDAFGKVDKNPTNNTAEIMGAIRALEFAHEKDIKHLKLMLDSQYVIDSITSYITKWIANAWKKSDGEPVKNKGLLIRLKELKDSYEALGYHLEFIKVKGHSGNLGNDKADINALRGLEAEEDCFFETFGEEINKVKKIQLNPLILESRLIFPTQEDEVVKYYYTYNLGRLHGFGTKPKDTAKDKLAKADLLLGRRMSEATYSVYKAEEPDEYLELLKGLHREALGKKEPELAIINLTNACNAKQRQQIESLGLPGLLVHEDIHCLATPQMALVSRTLNPPRLANDAISVFNILEKLLDDFLLESLGESITNLDITDQLFETEEKGKKTSSRVKKDITNNTPYLEIKVTLPKSEALVRLVFSIDIPTRNQLVKIAPDITSVNLLVSMTGPCSYIYSVVFKTTDGAAIYSSPYAQLITKI